MKTPNFTDSNVTATDIRKWVEAQAIINRMGAEIDRLHRENESLLRIIDKQAGTINALVNEPDE